jgi:hypothetical protein
VLDKIQYFLILIKTKESSMKNIDYELEMIKLEIEVDYFSEKLKHSIRRNDFHNTENQLSFLNESTYLINLYISKLSDINSKIEIIKMQIQ